MKKKIIVLTIFGLAAAGIVVFGTTTASANWFGGDDTNMVASLAQKLGVGENKVKGAFDSMRSERESQMQTKYEEYLTQTVKDGKISEAQKQLILAKNKELKAEREEMRKKHEEFVSWADTNGIDPGYLYSGFGHKGMQGHGFGKF